MPPAAEQGPFLAAILANPDDKKARTIYADLLQDRGDPRGDFIALQCARADLAADDPRAGELDESIAALLKKHKKAWTSACGEAKGARWDDRAAAIALGSPVFAKLRSLDLAHNLSASDRELVRATFGDRLVG